MRELLTMWRNSRMIMLTAITAAIFAAVLIPFKAVTIIPGVASVRPANVFPLVFGLMFGPAGAWGSGIGNLIGDIFGGNLSPGNLFGFIGNFFYAFMAYKLWGNLGPLSSGEEPDMRSNPGRQLLEYTVIAAVAGMAPAIIVAWGLEILGLFPFVVLGVIITFNDFIPAMILGPPILYLTYPRIREMGLLYPDVLDPEDLPTVDNARQQFAALGMAVVAVAWLVIGILLSLNQGYGIGIGTEATFGEGGSQVQIVLGAIGFLLLLGFGYLGGQRLPGMLGYEPTAQPSDD